MKILKRYYFIILVILVLLCITIYSTYAMFNASVESNIVNMDTDINYRFKINGTQDIKVSPNSKIRFNATLKNDMDGNISYGIYYKMINPNSKPDTVVIAQVSDNLEVLTKGTIGKDSSKTVPMVIKNTGSSEATIEIGVRTGYEDNGVDSIIYNEGEIPVVEFQTSAEAGDDSCTSTMECTSKCTSMEKDGEWVEACYCYTGNKVKGRTIVSEIKSLSNGSKTTINGMSSKALTYKEHLWYTIKYRLSSSDLDRYFTYASSYTFDKNKSAQQYTLTSPQVGKYSSIYEQLVGKYVVSYAGSTSSELASYTNRNEIYKIISADANGLIEYESLVSEGDSLDLSDTGVWETPDDYGTSYYFRGDVKNNYVKFGEYKKDIYFGYNSSIETRYYKIYDSLNECQSASDYNKYCKIGISKGTPMYFRIVRIEGNDNIRLVYDGTSAHANDESSFDKLLGRMAYNSKYDDNAYVGYMYGSTGVNSYSSTHENNNSSDIKTKLEKWYNDNLSSYSNVIATDTVFCNDRSTNTNNSDGSYTNYGYNKEKTNYRWAYSPRNGSSYGNPNPKLTCPLISNDGMSVSSATKGNHKLSEPVGLLTTDEAVFAGGWDDGDDRNYYLYAGYNYWLMSPGIFDGNYARVRCINLTGSTSNYINVNSTEGIKPVISLKPSTLFTGTGTKDDPYIVVSD